MPRSLIAIAISLLAVAVAPNRGWAWSESEFANRPEYAYPIPEGHDALIGQLQTYEVQNGDTLLDIGRYYGVTAKEISDANNHLDWWSPKAGTSIVLPTEHIVPEGERAGLVLNIPEMRLYYFQNAALHHHRHRGVSPASYDGSSVGVVYTFPVGLGRYDWKTPVAKFHVRGKTKNPAWVVPDDIYEEHLERDGEAEHMIEGGDPANPLGLFRIELSLPLYALHGTNNPWGIGMEVSHGCIRLYPEDIKRLFYKVRIGTPGRFAYQPVKFGWRGDALYVEVHDDLYAKYPGLWIYAVKEAKRLRLNDQIDFRKLQKAVEEKAGIPLYVMPGDEPAAPTG